MSEFEELQDLSRDLLVLIADIDTAREKFENQLVRIRKRAWRLYKKNDRKLNGKEQK